MILQELNNYYKILRDDPSVEIAEPGYSNAPVSHALNISLEGVLLDIIPLFVTVQKGKKTVEAPRRINVPEQIKRSVNVAPNFMCDNAAYVLGLTEKEAKDAGYAKKRFELFRAHNIDILSKVKSPAARAIILFLQKHDPEKAIHDPIITRNLKDIMEGRNLIFYVEGKHALDDAQIRQAWEDYSIGKESLIMQCSVTGEMKPIARLHPDIKGVRDAQTKGASLVSFNLDAFTSYGRSQGVNSPVSRQVASGYCVALNYLLSAQNPNRKIYLGDATVVYWADTTDKRYANTFMQLINPEYRLEEKADRQEAESELAHIASLVEKGKPLDIKALHTWMDSNTLFYVLGLSPSAARIAVRFFLSKPFSVFAENIMQHYLDLAIEKEWANQPTFISPFRILTECVSPKVSKRDEEIKKTWSLLGGSLMRSILTGTPYPEGLYAGMLNRIRHDTDEGTEGNKHTKINYIRTAYIKAHLIRKYRRRGDKLYEEALQMSLNESYTNPAYVLGRLFAWLEKAQREAIGQNINATIKDRYFTSACATPASVFPTLLRLTHHHIQKAEYGPNLERNIQSLMNLLEAKQLPFRLTLDEQGIFILGYYHQRAAFYTKDSDKQ